MILFPEVNLPDYFTILLKSNFKDNEKSIGWLRQAVIETEAFHSLILKYFAQEENNKLDYVLSSFGWAGIRDRLASIYIYYKSNGEYPHVSHKLPAHDLVAFESRVASFTVTGHSRAFMLAFYLKMARLELFENDPDAPHDHLTIDEGLIGLLRHSRVKIYEIDWMLMLLKNLEIILGIERLTELVNLQKSFEEIFTELSADDHKSLVGNLLAYGYSINEPAFFLNEMV